MKKLIILPTLVLLIVLSVVLSTSCTNPGKVRAIELNIVNVEKTTIDGIDAVKINLGEKKYTNPNAMVDPELSKTWFGIGNPKVLEELMQIKDTKITLCYRSIDEERGSVLIIFFRITS